MAEGRVWMNGAMVAESQARVSIFDRGFVYGDAAYAGTVKNLKAELMRLRRMYRDLEG